MRTLLRSVVDAILGRVPSKTGRPDTATRMAMDADLSYRRELSRLRPERDDQHLLKTADPLADLDLLEELIRIVNKAQERDAEDERRGEYDPMLRDRPAEAKNRKKVFHRQVVHSAGLDEFRGTLFASRKSRLPGPARGVPSNDCSPASSPSARGQPRSTQSMPSGAGQTGPYLRQNFVPEHPSGVTFAVIDCLKTLRGPGESYSEVILALAKG